MPEFKTPIATVDVVLFTLREGTLSLGLLRREQPPYAGELALPGGFVHVEEDADAAAAAHRVLRQKSGLVCRYLEQLYTFTGRVRDPRGWSISIAYYALVQEHDFLTHGDAFTLVPADRVPALPFDHDRIVATALSRLRNKSTYSSLPAYLLPVNFTISELHGMYETIIGTPLDRVSFRRKIEEQGIVEMVEGSRRIGAHRPAQLYRLADRTLREFERKI